MPFLFRILCIYFPLSTLSSLLCVFDRHHAVFNYFVRYILFFISFPLLRFFFHFSCTLTFIRVHFDQVEITPLSLSIYSIYHYKMQLGTYMCKTQTTFSSHFSQYILYTHDVHMCMALICARAHTKKK